MLKDDRVFEISKALTGKVIGEFICNKIDEYECEFVDDDCLETVYLIAREDCDDEDYPDRMLIWSNECDYFYPDAEIIKGSRVSYNDLKKYIGYGFNTFYGWHISDLKIYDKPKELKEFQKPCKMDLPMCDRCEHYSIWDSRCENITRPPQSWCYVEEI